MDILSLWKSVPQAKRQECAQSFYEDKSLKEFQGAADTYVARLKNFRPQFVKKLPQEKRASYLAHLPLSAELASQLLVSYHFAKQRPLMKAFLDALAVPNDNGLIAEDHTPERPDDAKLAEAVSALRARFPAEDVDLYLNVLQTQGDEIWGGLAKHSALPASV
jgi:hypothetical protein